MNNLNNTKPEFIQWGEIIIKVADVSRVYIRQTYPYNNTEFVFYSTYGEILCIEVYKDEEKIKLKEYIEYLFEPINIKDVIK